MVDIVALVAADHYMLAFSQDTLYILLASMFTMAFRREHNIGLHWKRKFYSLEEALNEAHSGFVWDRIEVLQ